MRFANEYFEVMQGTAGGVDISIVGNVISVVTHRRRIKREQP